MKDANSIIIRTAALVVLVAVIGLISRHIYPVNIDTKLSDKWKSESESPDYIQPVMTRSLLESDMITLNFDNAKALANQVLNLIYNRYELYDDPGSQFFLTANNYGEKKLFDLNR